MAKPLTNPRRALGYGRVSTALQATEGESLAVQDAQLRALCTLAGLELAGVYLEEGVSGAKPFLSRPQGARLWQDAQRGDVIVCMKLDRLTRSPRDALDLLERCRERGIGLIIGDMGHGDATRGAVASMLVGILSSVSGFERERNGERVREVRAMQKAAGRFTGGAVPFACKIVERDGERFIVADVAIQDRVAKLKGQGYSARSMVGALKGAGITVSHVTLTKYLREAA
ncbi:MAG: recombinase family protein [Rhodospirillales bacterium]|nr:recombinase family protein [Rhodospirillales bacterium]